MGPAVGRVNVAKGRFHSFADSGQNRSEQALGIGCHVGRIGGATLWHLQRNVTCSILKYVDCKSGPALHMSGYYRGLSQNDGRLHCGGYGIQILGKHFVICNNRRSIGLKANLHERRSTTTFGEIPQKWQGLTCVQLIKDGFKGLGFHRRRRHRPSEAHHGGHGDGRTG